MKLALALALILAAGVLAFGVTKAFGARFGAAVVALVAALNLPFLLAYIPLLFPETPTEAAPSFSPTDTSFGAAGYMFLGAVTFAGLTIVSAITGSFLGMRTRQRHVT
ncbi:hypothetical protein [Gymnodinialimonas sp. 57CJ19]|uniref:hypothetical protein n=1 Tax=Gymnodinialimonas sp. 57CJ19 TaxID=3138498 RepID=UPI0031344B1F